MPEVLLSPWSGLESLYQHSSLGRGPEVSMQDVQLSESERSMDRECPNPQEEKKELDTIWIDYGSPITPK
ncbi:hypothetical protein ACTXT7_002750 [Hymenolepis weldensis]